MASTDDILSAQKNGVQAINNLAQVTKNIVGAVSSGTISATTYIPTTYGWIGKISIITAGSTNGTIYDASSTASASSSNALVTIPSTATAGTIVTVNMPVTNGLVITPGTGMVLVVSYS
jgi:hypothetical protein